MFAPAREEFARLHFYWADRGMVGALMFPDDVSACSWEQLGGAGYSIQVIGQSRDAGPFARIDGPDEKSLALPVLREGLYEREIAPRDTPFFSPGMWTVSAPGGTGIGAFQATLSISPPIRLRNPESLIAMRRDSDFTIEWDTSGFGSNDAVSIFLQTWPFEGRRMAQKPWASVAGPPQGAGD